MNKIECKSKYHRGERLIPSDDMIKDKSRKSGYAPYCKLCRLAMRKANKQSSSNNDKRYYQKNKDRLKQQFKDRYYNNPSKYKTYTGKWINHNIPTSRALWARSRANQLNATVDWSSKDMIYFFYQEAYHLEQQDGIKRHVDHIIPLVGKYVCGLHCEDNLQILTATENKQKKNIFN